MLVSVLMTPSMDRILDMSSLKPSISKASTWVIISYAPVTVHVDFTPSMRVMVLNALFVWSPATWMRIKAETVTDHFPFVGRGDGVVEEAASE